MMKNKRKIECIKHHLEIIKDMQQKYTINYDKICHKINGFHLNLLAVSLSVK